MSERATPEKAGEVWDAYVADHGKEPSLNEVARRLTAAGFKCDKTQVKRWKERGWSESDADHRKPAAEEQKDKLDRAAANITGDPTATIEDFEAYGADILDKPLHEAGPEAFNRILACLAGAADYARENLPALMRGDNLPSFNNTLNTLAGSIKTMMDAANGASATGFAQAQILEPVNAIERPKTPLQIAIDKRKAAANGEAEGAA